MTDMTEALAARRRRGNTTIAARAATLDAIRAAGSMQDGATLLAAVLREDRNTLGPIGGARARTLLLAVPRVGDTKVRLLLAAVNVRDTNRRLRELTVRQRYALADALEAL